MATPPNLPTSSANPPVPTAPLAASEAVPTVVAASLPPASIAAVAIRSLDASLPPPSPPAHASAPTAPLPTMAAPSAATAAPAEAAPAEKSRSLRQISPHGIKFSTLHEEDTSFSSTAHAAVAVERPPLPPSLPTLPLDSPTSSAASPHRHGYRRSITPEQGTPEDLHLFLSLRENPYLRRESLPPSSSIDAAAAAASPSRSLSTTIVPSTPEGRIAFGQWFSSLPPKERGHATLDIFRLEHNERDRHSSLFLNCVLALVHNPDCVHFLVSSFPFFVEALRRENIELNDQGMLKCICKSRPVILETLQPRSRGPSIIERGKSFLGISSTTPPADPPTYADLVTNFIDASLNLSTQPQKFNPLEVLWITSLLSLIHNPLSLSSGDTNPYIQQWIKTYSTNTHITENLNFLQAVQAFEKKCLSPDVQAEELLAEAQMIVTTYINEEAPQPINIDSSTLKGVKETFADIEKNPEDPKELSKYPTLFRAAKEAIISLVNGDSMRRLNEIINNIVCLHLASSRARVLHNPAMVRYCSNNSLCSLPLATPTIRRAVDPSLLSRSLSYSGGAAAAAAAATAAAASNPPATPRRAIPRLPIPFSSDAAAAAALPSSLAPTLSSATPAEAPSLPSPTPPPLSGAAAAAAIAAARAAMESELPAPTPPSDTTRVPPPPPPPPK